MGHVGGRRFSVGELHAASKTSSANGSHLDVWDFDISAAEFPQQKKRASLVWIGPKGPFRPTAENPSRKFYYGYIKAPYIWMEVAWNSPTEKTLNAAAKLHTLDLIRDRQPMRNEYLNIMAWLSSHGHL